MAGVSIVGASSGAVPVVTVPSPATLSIIYTTSNSYKPTSLTGIGFSVLSTVIPLPLIQGTGTPQSSFVVNSVSFVFGGSLGAPLITLSTFGSLQFTNLSIVRGLTYAPYALRNADEASDICGSLTDSPGLLIKDSTAVIVGSTFQGINTGVLLFLFVSFLLNNSFLIFSFFFFLFVLFVLSFVNFYIFLFFHFCTFHQVRW
jgi:hypothetical protein